MSEFHPSVVTDYYNKIRDHKQALFALYEDEHLVRKIVARGNGWTWGYELFVNGKKATGSSIGEDEIKLLFDLSHIINARFSYCIGVAFGFSTFNLALAKPDTLVFGIDNYSERAGPSTEYARELVERIIQDRCLTVYLHIGTSPEDTPTCLSSLPRDEKLSLVFIDGLHRNPAAKADFDGIRPFINSKTVILWHNVYSVSEAFMECFDQQLFDQNYVLRTYGVMGIYFNAVEHPSLDRYLHDSCLVWDDWKRNFTQLIAQYTHREKRLIAFVRGAVVNSFC